MNIKQIEKLAKQGLTRAQIARLLKLPYFRIQLIEGIEFKPGNGRNQFLKGTCSKAEIFALKTKGFDIEQIALILDCPVMEVYRVDSLELSVNPHPDSLASKVSEKSRSIASGKW